MNKDESYSNIYQKRKIANERYGPGIPLDIPSKIQSSIEEHQKEKENVRQQRWG